jgi:hypothetical protein
MIRSGERRCLGAYRSMGEKKINGNDGRKPRRDETIF